MSFISQPPQPPEMPFDVATEDGGNKIQLFEWADNGGAIRGTYHGEMATASLVFQGPRVRFNGEKRPFWFNLPRGLRSLAMQDETMAGHTWQDVTASRSSGTVYQNTTGRPIMVAVNGEHGDFGHVEASADMNSWTLIGGVGGSNQRQVQFEWPDGTFWRYSGSHQNVAELRP
jgi:hypothetical protein